MWTFEHREQCSASAQDVWEQWSDPTSWPGWDAGIEWVQLYGPFEVGTRGKLKPTGSRAVKFKLTSVEPNRGFSDETKLPGAILSFSHTVQPSADGVEISHRVTIRGPLTRLFARVIGREFQRELPDTVRSLAAAAESKSR